MGLPIAHALGDPGLEESANFYLGQVHHWVGNYTAGVALLRRNVGSLEAQLSRQGFAVKQFVNSRTFLAWSLAELGEFTEATACTDQAIAVAEATGSAYALIHACSGAGVIHLRRGDLP